MIMYVSFDYEGTPALNVEDTDMETVYEEHERRYNEMLDDLLKEDEVTADEIHLIAEEADKYYPFEVTTEDLKSWVYDKVLYNEYSPSSEKFITTPYVYNRLKDMIIECIGYFIKEEVPLYISQISITPFLDCIACNYCSGEWFEFSEEYVYTTTDNTLRGLVLHELCHTPFGGKNHTDPTWINGCKKFWKYCKHKWWTAEMSYNGKQFDKKRLHNWHYRYGYNMRFVRNIEKSKLFIDSVPGSIIENYYIRIMNSTDFKKWWLSLTNEERRRLFEECWEDEIVDKYFETKGGLRNE